MTVISNLEEAVKSAEEKLGFKPTPDEAPVENTEPAPDVTPDPPVEPVNISDSNQAHADSLGVDTSTMTGTGKDGSITKKDVTAQGVTDAEAAAVTDTQAEEDAEAAAKEKARSESEYTGGAITVLVDGVQSTVSTPTDKVPVVKVVRQDAFIAAAVSKKELNPDELPVTAFELRDAHGNKLPGETITDSMEQPFYLARVGG